MPSEETRAPVPWPRAPDPLPASLPQAPEPPARGPAAHECLRALAEPGGLAHAAQRRGERYGQGRGIRAAALRALRPRQAAAPGLACAPGALAAFAPVAQRPWRRASAHSPARPTAAPRPPLPPARGAGLWGGPGSRAGSERRGGSARARPGAGGPWRVPSACRRAALTPRASLQTRPRLGENSSATRAGRPCSGTRRTRRSCWRGC